MREKRTCACRWKLRYLFGVIGVYCCWFSVVCRSCIVRYVQSNDNRERCPTCNVVIKEAQPMAGLRLDRTLQDIVDKLLPKVHEDEERRKEFFMATRHLEGEVKYSKPPSTSNSPVMRVLPSPDEDKVSLLLKPENPKNLPGDFLFEKYLRCSARMTVAHLKRFLVAKSNWKSEQSPQLDIFCKGNPLRDELTLEFIWRIRWGNKKQLMVLEYGHQRERTSSHSSPMPEKRRRRRKRRLRNVAAQSPSTNGEGESSDSKNAENGEGEISETLKRPRKTTPSLNDEQQSIEEMKNEANGADVESDSEVVLVKCVRAGQNLETTQKEQ